MVELIDKSEQRMGCVGIRGLFFVPQQLDTSPLH